MSILTIKLKDSYIFEYCYEDLCFIRKALDIVRKEYMLIFLRLSKRAGFPNFKRLIMKYLDWFKLFHSGTVRRIYNCDDEWCGVGGLGASTMKFPQGSLFPSLKKQLKMLARKRSKEAKKVSVEVVKYLKGLYNSHQKGVINYTDIEQLGQIYCKRFYSDYWKALKVIKMDRDISINQRLIERLKKDVNYATKYTQPKYIKVSL